MLWGVGFVVVVVVLAVANDPGEDDTSLCRVWAIDSCMCGVSVFLLGLVVSSGVIFDSDEESQ